MSRFGRSLAIACLAGIFVWPMLEATSSRGATPESINLRETVVVQVVRKTHMAVVSIQTTKLVTARGGRGRGGIPQPNTPRVGHALGSGFIIHPDGYIVTNNHVVEGGREIQVEMYDGTKVPGQVISADPDADLAVIKIDKQRKPYPFLDLGDSEDLMIGEPAIAIGNPFGFSHSVSTGIVSAVHRDLKDGAGPVDAAYENLIQTDAAINPGNSGGPLLNAYGQVIGINTAIESSAQNIGFAIPINRLRDLIPELMDTKQTLKIELPVKLAERRIITEPDTVNCEIFPADDPQHVVATIDGKTPHNIVEAYAILRSAQPGVAITVKFADGATKPYVPTGVALPKGIMLVKQKFGLNVIQMTPVIAQENNMTQEQGMYIDSVDADSPASQSHPPLQHGDVVVEIKALPVLTLDKLTDVMGKLPQVGTVRVKIYRNDSVKYIDLVVGDSQN